MKKIERLLLVVFLLGMVGCTTDFDEAITLSEKEVNAMFSHEDAVENVLTVKFSRETADEIVISQTRSGELTTGNISLDEICREFDVVGIERVFPVNKYEPRKRKMGLDQWYVVKVGGRYSAGETAVRLQKMQGVQAVAPQVKVKRQGTSVVRYATEEEMATLSAKNAPRANEGFNDPLLPEQWMLKNIGSESDVYGDEGFIAGADINVEGAWKLCGGSNNVIVSVVDGGVEYTHPDLAANMWDGIGRNFVGNRTGSSNITADEHGTHVAGTVAAVSNNGIGIAGIAGGRGYNDGVKIMSCQIFTSEDSATDTESAAAIVFAADNGAVISQNSWGYPISYAYNDTTFNTRLSVIKDAIDYFVQMAGMDENGETQVGPMAGGVVIFAAGNDGKQQSEYPASYGNCLSVAAMTGMYKASWFSTYSTAVDLFAPGGDSASSTKHTTYAGWNLSTLPTHIKNGDTYKENGKTYVIDYVRTPGYGYMIGTSMACPHVSGAAALIVSYCGGEGFTNTRLKELLLSTAKNVDDYQDSAHKGKVGKLVDVTAAFEKGGPGSNYTPMTFPVIRLKGDSNELFLLKGEKSQIVYELQNCDRIEVSDPKIEMSQVGDDLILSIDTSLYELGTYEVTITGHNNDGKSNAVFRFHVEDISADMYPNPFDKELNIRLNKIKGDWRNCDARIVITNSAGASVFNFDVKFEGRFPINFNTEKLNPGRYEVDVDVVFGEYRHTIKRTVVKR